MGVEFKKVSPQEAEALKRALNRNAAEGTPLKMDALTTGWSPGDDEASSEEQLINAIHSVPCHYVAQAMTDAEWQKLFDLIAKAVHRPGTADEKARLIRDEAEARDAEGDLDEFIEMASVE